MGSFYSKAEIAEPLTEKQVYALKPKSTKKSDCCGNFIVWYIGFLAMYFFSPW